MSGLIEDDESGEIVFDPDLELEWELGPDVQIVFEADDAA